MKKIINGICVAMAFVCMGLGILGIVLPVLPTTPLLLAATCMFAKGSERFHKWFLSTKLYKKYIESAVKDGTMEKAAKRNMMITLGIVFLRVNRCCDSACERKKRWCKGTAVS